MPFWRVADSSPFFAWPSIEFDVPSAIVKDASGYFGQLNEELTGLQLAGHHEFSTIFFFASNYGRVASQPAVSLEILYDFKMERKSIQNS